jgi:hypothetical protein
MHAILFFTGRGWQNHTAMVLAPEWGGGYSQHRGCRCSMAGKVPSQQGLLVKQSSVSTPYTPLCKVTCRAEKGAGSCAACSAATLPTGQLAQAVPPQVQQQPHAPPPPPPTPPPPPHPTPHPTPPRPGTWALTCPSLHSFLGGWGAPAAPRPPAAGWHAAGSHPGSS